MRSRAEREREREGEGERERERAHAREILIASRDDIFSPTSPPKRKEEGERERPMPHRQKGPPAARLMNEYLPPSPGPLQSGGRLSSSDTEMAAAHVKAQRKGVGWLRRLLRRLEFGEQPSCPGDASTVTSETPSINPGDLKRRLRQMQMQAHLILISRAA